MDRRRFLEMGALGMAGALAGCHLSLEQGMFNPCHEKFPREIKRHKMIKAAWRGIDDRLVWDCHAHLVGVGDSDSGAWITPDMESLSHPVQYIQKTIYMNAACAEVDRDIDRAFLRRLIQLHKMMPAGVRLMLMAFDWHHDEAGRPVPAQSTFHTPNDYARRVAAAFPERFEWIASIHPYREDCVEALKEAVAGGARAVKWLPQAMGIDPGSPLCDRFYDALAAVDLPLISHAGAEKAVEGPSESFGNPLKLRRALNRGVRVVVAHCASLGEEVDLDEGPEGPTVESFSLFERLMDEPAYQGRVFGELSAMTQSNRVGRPLQTVIDRTDWHPRLVNGTDYPLPGVMPLFSLAGFVNEGYLERHEASVLEQIRIVNPLLFDFVLKRHLQFQGKKLSPIVFYSRRVFDKGA